MGRSYKERPERPQVQRNGSGNFHGNGPRQHHSKKTMSKCFSCGKPGHHAANCRTKPPTQSNDRQRTPRRTPTPPPATTAGLKDTSRATATCNAPSATNAVDSVTSPKTALAKKSNVSRKNDVSLHIIATLVWDARDRTTSFQIHRGKLHPISNATVRKNKHQRNVYALTAAVLATTPKNASKKNPSANPPHHGLKIAIYRETSPLSRETRSKTGRQRSSKRSRSSNALSNYSSASS